MIFDTFQLKIHGANDLHLKNEVGGTFRGHVLTVCTYILGFMYLR